MVESTYNAGKVFNLETMSSTEIPNIESPYDITDIYRIKDLYKGQPDISVFRQQQ